MVIKKKFNKFCLYFISSVISPVFLYTPVLQAQQALEEVFVTAQRREQSIQEVPISLEAYSGDMLTREGLRTMEDLANFSPSVEIDVRTMDQDIAIRGMGTTGNNLGLEQAAPTFVDGIHYGRTSMIQSAFMDLERVEILRGPQPVYFGQNATAGAFSLTTRKPTPEWQGNISVEYGRFGRVGAEGGVGGPITDTLGIRVAGKYDNTDGHMRDIATGGTFPKIKQTGARVTLQWVPTDAFEMTFKTDWSQTRRGGDGRSICLTTDLSTAAGARPPILDEESVWKPGTSTFEYFNENVSALDPLPDCSEGGKLPRVGIEQGAKRTFVPIPVIRHSRSSTGIIDISTVQFDAVGENLPQISKYYAHDDMDTLNFRLGMSYQFDHGGTIESTTAFIDFDRSTIHDNSDSPFNGNGQARGEIFDMMSQDFRYYSPRGGRLEWEAGAYWQKEDLDIGNTGDPEFATTVVRGILFNPVWRYGNWQDSEWLSAYGGFTFNFLDDRASIDVGGRYTKVNKQSYASAEGAHYIFDIDPDPDGNGIVESTNVTDQAGSVVRNVTSDVFNCGTTTYIGCGDFGAGFWTHAWRTRHIPDAWHTKRPFAIGPFFPGNGDGGTGPLPNLISGPMLRDLTEDNFDHQVTLRYRPSEDLSLYGKWATAFKSGGANIKTGILVSRDQFNIDPEFAETFEVGGKGNLFERRVNYNLTVFRITMKDQQIDTIRPVLDGGASTVLTGLRVTTNAGRQRTQGIELDARWAVTDRFTAGFSGALMDGKVLAFAGAGCTEFEFNNADTGPCVSNAESLASAGTDNPLIEGTIDRSGSKATRTPDWKFVVDLDYRIPMFDNYQLSLGSKTTFSDAYINEVTTFDPVISYPKRVVANLNVGYGDLDDTWNLRFYARNIFNEGIEYFPEFDVAPDWNITDVLSERNWRTYGLQFQYNYY